MTGESFLDGKVQLFAGDCLDVLKTLEPSSVDSIVTDPPYGLEFMGKGWDGADGFRRSLNKSDAERDSVFGRTSKRGPEYRAGSLFQEFVHAVAIECLRVLKPGGHLVSFGGTRTYHRMACAIEDAGFDIRDCIQWLYGSGFPKSLDVSNAIDKANGVKGDYGAPKSAAHAGWIDRGQMRGDEGHEGYQRPWMQDEGAVDRAARQYLPCSPEAQQFVGFGTALKPAVEPVVLARKPLIGTVAENVLKHGTGALNIDACRVGSDTRSRSTGELLSKNLSMAGGNYAREVVGSVEGRWPANVIHDGSDEVVGAFPQADGPAGAARPESVGTGNGVTYMPTKPQGTIYAGEKGSAARFFYTAKADADDRLGSKHPTVKPLDLMQYLVRLVTPPKGLVLDPFAGTGTTGEAAWREGFNAVLIEREEEYQNDIRRRMALCLSGPAERKRESIKARAPEKPFEAGTLFA